MSIELDDGSDRLIAPTEDIYSDFKIYGILLRSINRSKIHWKVSMETNNLQRGIANQTFLNLEKHHDT